MSKVIIRHFGKVLENGKIIFNDESMWENQRLSLRGKDFELIIKEKLRRPTPNQYGYYFGGILGTLLTCEAFSHFTTPEDIHKQLFAPMFLSYSDKVYLGKASWTVQHIRSLGDLSKSETSEFVEKVLQWCAENDIEILPSDAYVNKYYKEIDIKE